jgi:hypothetical protein
LPLTDTVGVAVGVAVAVAVVVAVTVAVAVTVTVGVRVGTRVGVGVKVGTAVGVGVKVGTAVGVGVGVFFAVHFGHGSQAEATISPIVARTTRIMVARVRGTRFPPSRGCLKLGAKNYSIPSRGCNCRSIIEGESLRWLGKPHPFEAHVQLHLLRCSADRRLTEWSVD